MLILVLILILGANGWCHVINIPADYPTVQQGLNAAAEDDTVLVADGTYYENLKFPPINLILASEFLMDGDSAHIAETILDGSQPANPDSASVIFMDGGQDSSTCVVGFTITGGMGTLDSLWWPGYNIRVGGGVAIYQASPIIKFNHITLDSAAFGSGVYLGSGADAIIQNNELWQNHCTIDAGTIRGDTCSPQIIGNIIHHNSAYSAAGLCFLYCQEVLILDNDIHHNTAVSFVAGYFAHGNFTLIGNTISDHTTSDPMVALGTGFSFGQSNVTILNNQFLRNTNGFLYGALTLLSQSSGVISNNLFQDNASISKAAALDLWGGTYMVSYNQFINNHDDQYGVVYIGRDAAVNIHHNIITGSTNLTRRASAILANINLPISIHDNNIYGNSPPAVAPDTLIFLTVDAINNWWGDPSGPYHPILNPSGLGDAVGDNVLFDPWLTSYVGIQNNPIETPPSAFRLHPVFPNPFNAVAVLGFELPIFSRVSLRVYDTAGRLVTALVDGWRDAGAHQITFDGAGLPSGIYFAKLSAGELSHAQKLVLMK